MTYLAIITDKETKIEKFVYLFSYLEVLCLMPQINPESHSIELTEAQSVYDLDGFINSTDNLISDDFWLNFNNKLDDEINLN